MPFGLFRFAEAESAFQQLLQPSEEPGHGRPVDDVVVEEYGQAEEFAGL